MTSVDLLNCCCEDVESVSLGRYVLLWRRAAVSNLAIINETVFELPTIKELTVFLQFEIDG
jgi:hypothetical protein